MPAETESAHPFIHIEQRPGGVDPTGFDLDVKAHGLASTDEVAMLLLLVVERLTGVSADLYTQQIDMMRRVARGGPAVLVPLDDEDEGDTTR